jgi:nitrite reductase/ring-hydroxylating ferredoxin subunit
MTKFKACDVADMVPDSVRQITAPGGETLALYRLADGFYATDDICSHGAAFLSEGDIEGGDIMCPFHGGTFDIKTGEPTAAPCVVPIRSHLVTLEDDAVYIELQAD